MGGTLKNEGEGVGGVDILVEGPAGFSESATTDDTGRWSVPLPGGGEYTATLQVETLPDGIAPRDPDNVSRTIQVGTTSTANVLFPSAKAPRAEGTSLRSCSPV
ncbi:hypothetical protein [Humidisolicoccus flavus]|uniref:hypothetical protein n=1 Tax=Humidisolicoccus flavus TaxID=3111414 RepID=UPI003252ADE1